MKAKNKSIEDEILEEDFPPPKIAPPVFFSVPAPPPAPVVRPSRPIHRSSNRAPVMRSQSMSTADRYVSGPPPRFRPPPPPIEITELPPEPSQPPAPVIEEPKSGKRHFIHQGNQVTVIEANYNSLERGTRRKLPPVPHNNAFQSLPRQPKRNKDTSGSRERHRIEDEKQRRQLPQLPAVQDREPTPDYDSIVNKDAQGT